MGENVDVKERGAAMLRREWGRAVLRRGILFRWWWWEDAVVVGFIFSWLKQLEKAGWLKFRVLTLPEGKSPKVGTVVRMMME